jgi:hypothetical protein
LSLADEDEIGDYIAVGLTKEDTYRIMVDVKTAIQRKKGSAKWPQYEEDRRVAGCRGWGFAEEMRSIPVPV